MFVGRQEHEAVLRYVRAADVFVLSSRTEGLSHVLLETLSVGTPAVATRVGGNPEVLTDDVNGLLIPSEDPAALAAAIQRLITDPALAARLAEAGRVRSADFSWDATVSQTLTVISFPPHPHHLPPP
jgi:glycosyltransferase involved in cell wall biosynthesis